MLAGIRLTLYFIIFKNSYVYGKVRVFGCI